MTPKRPYLLRAFYEWILDNNMTPYILVDATVEDVSVPSQHVKDGRIVLNVSPRAVQDYIMDNEAVSFSARFGGVAFYIYCPMHAVLAVYSRETQDGASFPPDEYAGLQPGAGAVDAEKSKPALVAITGGEAGLQAVASDDAETENTVDDDNDEETPPPVKPRPSLRVVK